MTDPYRHDDAAYVLGALSPAERAAFEQHLRGCAECTARVEELAGVPALLAGIDEAELTSPDPVPDTLLSGLLRRAAARRRRTRVAIGALASLAAACAIALMVVLWPAHPSAPARQSFVAVAQSPVRASAVLTARQWGTAIDVHCRYTPGVDQSFRYGLVVYGRDGGRYRLGDWKLPPDGDIDYASGTSLTRAEIAHIDITLPDGTPILRMRP